jgi:hypothetical protein
MADLSPRRALFREELRGLIRRNTHPWSGTATVYRREVEEIGASVDLTKTGACSTFFSLRGSLWDLRTGSIVQSMISTSADLAEEDPPRRWSAFNDVFLL